MQEVDPRARLGLDLLPLREDEVTREQLVESMIADYEQHGTPIELQVKWLKTPIWVVPTEAAAETLVLENPRLKRGQVFTAREIGKLMLANLPQDQLRPVVLAKLEADGVVDAVQTRLFEPEAPATTEEVHVQVPPKGKFSLQRPYFMALRKVWECRRDGIPLEKHRDLVIQLQELEDQLGDMAPRLQRRWAQAWASETGSCPGCGALGPWHQEEALAA